MQMKPAIGYIRKHPYRSIVMLVIIAASCLAYWTASPDKLEFVELSSPTGFRMLVLAGKSSRLDPALGALQAATDFSNATKSAGGGSKICKALLQDKASPSVGKIENTFSIVEFFDYRCPYCKTLTKILASIRAGGRVRVVYKEWPILGKSSQLAARAALAADKQGNYLAFHTKLMHSGFIPTTGYIENLSRELDLNQTQFLKDMSSEETSAALRRNHALASELGFVGTPVLVVGRTIVEGAITQGQLEQLITLEMSSPPAC